MRPGSTPGTEQPAVDSLDLDISDGEFLVLVGPSGRGKSTALRMLAGLEDVDVGVIYISDSGESGRQRTMRPALHGSADAAIRVDGPKLTAIEVRNRHRIPVIRCTGVSAHKSGPAGRDNHRDPVMASHRPRGES
jgi:ABC-type cobalamin/Fe3+-siderophores transport system ATPase subunit